MSYYRTQYRPQVGLGGHVTPGIKALLIANVGVFALQVLGQQIPPGWDMVRVFGLSSELVLHKHYLWQLVTYMFLHAPYWYPHVLFNMLMLWMFGTEVERAWGTREFLKYYFLCGVGAGVTTCLVFQDSTTIGASGAVFGVIIAYGLLYPNRQILFWLMFPMRAISFVILCTGIELFTLLNLQDGVAHFAHLGGMLFGYLYLKRVWRLKQFWSEVRWRVRRRRFRVMRPDDENYPFH